MSNYQERFKDYTVEMKRKDLIINPLFYPEKVATATDEVIIFLHEHYFEKMNKAMIETIGESMYDDEF